MQGASGISKWEMVLGLRVSHREERAHLYLRADLVRIRDRRQLNHCFSSAVGRNRFAIITIRGWSGWRSVRWSSYCINGKEYLQIAPGPQGPLSLHPVRSSKSPRPYALLCSGDSKRRVVDRNSFSVV
jgi:hypothetical protein